MGAWNVILQDENGRTETILNGLLVVEVEKLAKLTLLKYLDPYGDTIFNIVQMDDLINDLQILNSQENNKEVDEVILSAQKCKQGVGLYLAFIGD